MATTVSNLGIRTVVGNKIKACLRGFIKRLRAPILDSAPVSKIEPWREWSIGIYVGRSPFDFRPANIQNPVVTKENFSDVDAEFVADPFMVRCDRIWYMFFEVMNRRTGKGEIGVAVSNNGLEWTQARIVLEEPFHLSYPYVFEWKNEYYMIPESRRANSVRLYRCVDFPAKWSFERILLQGDYADPSILFSNNKWWLFTGHGGAPHYGDTLRLYYSDELAGPWFEHPKSPLVENNPRTARPAGRVLVLDDKVLRYAQDCYPVYGSRVRAFEILELTETDYCEREILEPVLAGTGVGWNAAGMHQIDPHNLDDGTWIACVDGFFWQTVRHPNNLK